VSVPDANLMRIRPHGKLNDLSSDSEVDLPKSFYNLRNYAHIRQDSVRDCNFESSYDYKQKNLIKKICHPSKYGSKIAMS